MFSENRDTYLTRSTVARRLAMMPVRTAAQIILLTPLIVVAWHTLVRVVRHFYKFPIPQFLANVIDNPLRRRVQPPAATALRHGLQPGMRVLDIGPGNGRYTVAAAQRVGPTGHVVAVDIEPKMIPRVRQRAHAAGVTNLTPLVTSAHDLPFAGATFDAATMITVTGEIPEPVRALRDVRRVLRPGGTLACSELFVDPDYPLAQTLQTQAGSAGLWVKQRIGGFFYYTLIFER